MLAIRHKLLKCERCCRSQESTANSQVMEDLEEQMELRRLYAVCDQVCFFQTHTEE